MNPFFPEVARAVEDVAHKQGYTVVLCNSDESLEKRNNTLMYLDKNNVDGFIVATNPQNSVNYMNLSVRLLRLTVCLMSVFLLYMQITMQKSGCDKVVTR